MQRQAEYSRGSGAAAVANTGSPPETLPPSRCLEIYRLMVRSRALEELMIRMSKSGQGHFWIGGPGEEAFNVCLGLQVEKGRGLGYDFLHLHYRNNAMLLAMGMSPLDTLRQMALKATDPHSLGRNFVGHFARREWNLVPVSSVVGTQYVMALGTALMQKRHGGKGISIVIGGDAGTAEGDFASCLTWSSRPDNELPLLIVVTNNGWGISTATSTQHSTRHIIDRGKPLGIQGEVVDGNDPVASWHAVRRGMEYCRRQRRPFLLEAQVSRLYGHSSSSGALRVKSEPDCNALFEERLLRAGILDQAAIEALHASIRAELEAALEQVLAEPGPRPDDVHRHTYAPSSVDAVYPNDYTGLPE